MASPIDQLADLPTPQRWAVWGGGAVLIGALWYFLWYAESLEQTETARGRKRQAEADLVAIKKKRENHAEELRKAEEAEAQTEELLSSLPMASSALSNVMETFDKVARTVGLSITGWTPGGEQKFDYYARLQARVQATGTWHQAGEFFRKVVELQQIVSIENFEITAAPPKVPGGNPQLALTFDAATFRFLTDAEQNVRAGRKQGTGSSRRRRRNRDSGKKE